MLYLWKILDDYPDNLIGEYDREKGPDRFLFKEGKSLSSDLEKPIIHFKGDISKLQKFDDLANNALIPLISTRVQDILIKTCPNEVQFIDTIIYSNKDQITEFKLLNVINKVKGIDHDASEYLTIPGTKQIMKFKKLVYNKDCLGDLHIARDAEYTSNLIISSFLRDKLISSGATKNLGLYRPEEISW